MLTVGEINEAAKGELIQGEAQTKVRGVSIDSRSIKKHQCFIAIGGPRFNGHNFIRAAIRQGAIAVVVSKKVSCPGNIAVICVKDTTKALGLIASWYRGQFSIQVIAVT
jgi:UDP-N-acetylmuramoyl-tripeptide--D-alanyl-D-alanine ligase